MNDQLKIADRCFNSRLILGTARYPNNKVLCEAIAASKTEIITVSIRRFDPHHSQLSSLIRHMQMSGISILPNTAGCRTEKEAVLTAQLAREALGTDWIKLEIIGNDEETLLPDCIELLKAAETLIREGFTVLPYCNDDPVICARLADAGCAAIMPLGSPIGSGMGILNPYNLSVIKARVDVPLILDAGIRTASDVAKAMEIGCDGVMVNTAIAEAHDPVLMAQAMKEACRAGRNARLAGPIAQKKHAAASSPTTGVIGR